MHHRRVLAAWVVALGVAGMCLVACIGGGAQATSPAQELKADLAALVSARSVYLAGTVALQGVTYGVTLYEDDSGDANGGITANQQSINATYAGGHLFLRNPDYFAAQQLTVGARWVLADKDRLGPLVARLANRRELVAALTALAGSGVTRQDGGRVDGRDTHRLANDDLSATVPAAGGAPLRLATALDHQMSDGLADLKLTVAASSQPVTVTAPAPYVDPSNRSTLPAAFEEAPGDDSFRFDQCDDGGCTLTAAFHNAGGRDGTATATFRVAHGGTELGRCSITIPATDAGGTVRAGCRVNWDTSASDAEGSVMVTNPT